MKFIFVMQINIEVLYKWILSFWVSIGRHAQSIKNQEVCISLQYLQKNLGDKVYFLLVDKRKDFQHVYSIILGVCRQSC